VQEILVKDVLDKWGNYAEDNTELVIVEKYSDINDEVE
jgi:hypothetical protein